jgi:hypothetical protein
MNVSYSSAVVFFGATGDLAHKKIFPVLQAMARPGRQRRHPAILKVIIPLFVSVLFAATSAAQSATPVAVVEDFLKAWNSHGANAFDPLFTENAIWVPVAERRVAGHADVIKEFEQRPREAIAARPEQNRNAARFSIRQRQPQSYQV